MMETILGFTGTFWGGVAFLCVFLVLLLVVPFVVGEIHAHVQIPTFFFAAHLFLVYAFSVFTGFLKEGNGWKEALVGGALKSFLILLVNGAIINLLVPNKR